MLRRASYLFFIFCLIFDVIVTLKYGNPEGEINSVVRWLLNYYDFKNAVILYAMIEFSAISLIVSAFWKIKFDWTPIAIFLVIGAFHVQGALTWLVKDLDTSYKVSIIITIVFFVVVETIEKLTKHI